MAKQGRGGHGHGVVSIDAASSKCARFRSAPSISIIDMISCIDAQYFAAIRRIISPVTERHVALGGRAPAQADAANGPLGNDATAQSANGR